MPKKKKRTTHKKKKTKKRFRFDKKPVLIALAALLLLLLIYGIFLKFSSGSNILPKNASVLPVIDVSRWEGKINWDKVKKEGIQHAILKIGSGNHDGTGFNEDPLFKTNYKNAVKKKIKCGIYFFSYAITKEEAKKEALYCLDLLKKYNIEPDDLFFPVAFDIEYDKALRTGKRNCTDMTVAFLETIKSAGYDPMVYSSASYLEHKLIYSEIKDYKIWVANYEAEGPAFGKPYSMWQYSETGRVDGTGGYCDMNYWYSDYIEVQQLEAADDRLTLSPGEEKTLGISILPANATNKRLDYKSSNEHVVKITDDRTGMIKAAGTGTAWVTVRTPSGIKERIKVTVK